MIVNPITPSRPLLEGKPHLLVSVSPEKHCWAPSALLYIALMGATSSDSHGSITAIPVTLRWMCPARLAPSYRAANLEISRLAAHAFHARDACAPWLSQGRMYTLPDVWIRPPFGGKGRKVTGQLEAHANGFRYTSPKGEQLDIMYRCALRRESTARDAALLQKQK